MDAIRWQGDSLALLDQTKLPVEEVWEDYTDYRKVADAIRRLVVRGAPAIGIFAGHCLYVLARQLMEQGLSGPAFLSELNRQGKALVSSRPTAVNLAWAVGRLTHLAVRMADAPVEEIVSALGEEARAIREDIDAEGAGSLRDQGLRCWELDNGYLVVET